MLTCLQLAENEPFIIRRKISWSYWRSYEFNFSFFLTASAANAGFFKWACRKLCTRANCRLKVDTVAKCDSSGACQCV